MRTARDHDDPEERDAGRLELPLGDPQAVAVGCDLLPQGAGVPGCWASVRCDCGKSWKVDLLSEGVKRCPGCRVPYSHVLLVAPADDTEIVDDLLNDLEDQAAPPEPSGGLRAVAGDDDAGDDDDAGEQDAGGDDDDDAGEQDDDAGDDDDAGEQDDDNTDDQV